MWMSIIRVFISFVYIIFYKINKFYQIINLINYLFLYNIAVFKVILDIFIKFKGCEILHFYNYILSIIVIVII